jgi:hypothetical protein
MGPRFTTCNVRVSRPRFGSLNRKMRRVREPLKEGRHCPLFSCSSEASSGNEADAAKNLVIECSTHRREPCAQAIRTQLQT